MNICILEINLEVAYLPHMVMASQKVKKKNPPCNLLYLLFYNKFPFTVTVAKFNNQLDLTEFKPSPHTLFYKGGNKKKVCIIKYKATIQMLQYIFQNLESHSFPGSFSITVPEIGHLSMVNCEIQSTENESQNRATLSQK